MAAKSSKKPESKSVSAEPASVVLTGDQRILTAEGWKRMKRKKLQAEKKKG